MNNLCVIPARGGSKRIPRKNIKDFLGKPIIAYSIEKALESGLFKEVMVSTDDDEIARIAKYYGACIPFMRSKQNSNDFSVLSDVIEEIKGFYVSKDEMFDNICCILPTVPFITKDSLSKGYDVLIKNNIDSVRPVVRFSYPIQRAFKMSEDGTVKMFNPQFLKARSQDLEPAFHDAGMFYWMKFSSGMKGVNKMGFEIDGMECQDIDTPEDWRIAEFKYKYFFL